MLTISIVAIIVGVVISAGTFILLKKKMSAGSGANRQKLTDDYQKTDKDLIKLSQFIDSYASKTQFTTLVNLIDDLKSQLEQEKTALTETESKLETSQKTVEEQETIQQDLKSAKEEDEKKLEELLANCSKVSEEAVDLEQNLAEALKSLDNMLEQLDLTADQKAVMEEFSKALASAGGILRDLITEHNSLIERLNSLQEQHEDLEDEYTRLVEQQLGE